MNKFTFKIFLILDKILSPPPNFVLLNYNIRLKQHFTKIFKSKNLFLDLLKLFRYFFLYLLSYLFFPIAFILKILNFKFINIDLSQIGSLTYLDLLIKDNLLKKKLHKYRTFAMASYFYDGNSYLINLYSNYVIFVRNPIIKFLLSPFFMSSIFEDNSFRYDMVHHTAYDSHKIWNDFAIRYKKKNLITFPENDKKKITELLRPFVNLNKFVTLHVRDQNFYNRKKSLRDADINTYKDTIEYLIKNGYSVVRLGHSNSSKVNFDFDKNFFDYSKSPFKSPEIDVFLLSHCIFFIGCSSGPADIPKLFSINSCNVNHYTAPNAFNFMTGDLTSIKKIKYKKNKKLVPFDLLLKDPLAKNPSEKILEELGLFVEDNTSDEILQTVKEFINHRKKNILLQNKAKNSLSENNYSFNAKGNLSSVICEMYFTENNEA